MEMGKTLSDMELDFFEEFDNESQEAIEWLSDDEGEGEGEMSSAENKVFWESQHQLLQEALSRRSSTETRIQRDAEEAKRKLEESSSSVCGCLKECRQNCVLKNINDRLRDAGYNSALCKSKWRRSPEIPPGEHNYIDVVIESKKSTKKAPTRVVIEPNFRAEFEMARASAEYNGLVNSLTEIFVGNVERLRSVIKIMCAAAKKCMKDNKMHMAPWRKHKYMQSKWLGTCERAMPSLVLSSSSSSTAQGKSMMRPRASMLTFDLHCSSTAVKVL